MVCICIDVDPPTHVPLPDTGKQSTTVVVSISRTFTRRAGTAYISSFRCMQIALLAGVAASALAIPGVETAHWLTRALLMGSMLFAICGILITGLAGGIFYIFFGEDLENPNGQGVTLGESPEIQVLLHQVDILIGLPAQVCSYYNVPCGKGSSLIFL